MLAILFLELEGLAPVPFLKPHKSYNSFNSTRDAAEIQHLVNYSALQTSKI
jgi:hypothetical protein